MECEVHSVQYSVFSVQCSVFSVEFTICFVQCAVFSGQIYSVQNAVFSAHSLQCAILYIRGVTGV